MVKQSQLESAVWIEGRAMTLEEAMDYALDVRV